jgi:hypothetical protein
MTDPRHQIGRLAVREIRDEVRFFYAMPDTMKGALLLGTVKASILRRDRARFQALLTLYREAVADFIEDASGRRPTFNEPQTAPEHERGVEPWRGDA